MEIYRVSLSEAAQAKGIVIVIDVIRAFSVAAYAFAGGARRMWLVQTVDEAFVLHKREPEALLAGEVGGHLISGFDFNNSPTSVARANLLNRLLIQRTGAGTKGAVSAVNASQLLICSLANAQATATYARGLIEELDLEVVTLLPTAMVEMGTHPIEDDICADYLEALLRQQDNAQPVLEEGIAKLRDSGRLQAFEQGDPDLPAEDIAAFLDANRFSFAMVGRRRQWGNVTYVDVERVDVGEEIKKRDL